MDREISESHAVSNGETLRFAQNDEPTIFTEVDHWLHITEPATCAQTLYNESTRARNDIDAFALTSHFKCKEAARPYDELPPYF